MKNYFILLILLIMCSCRTNKVLMENVSLESDPRLSYTALIGSEPKAYLLLFPGFGEAVTDVLASTDLPNEVASHEIAVFIPVLQNGSETSGFSQESQENLKKVVADLTQRYGLAEKPYFVGGFSMGGATAIKYAEVADKKPSALFAIDSPLDYKRFLYATKRDIESYNKDSEDSIYAQLYREIDHIKNDSPYEIADSDHTAILPLKNIPVRVYIEPALDWWLNERHTDALGLNLIDATCFINDLRLLGNTKAELIVTEDKGFRKSTGQKHPHSWTIVDTKGLVKWLLNNTPRVEE